MYKGGKNGNGTYQTIINQIPKHEIYIEPFAGSAAIFRHKLAAVNSILCDKSREQCEKLKNKLSPSPIIINCDTIQSIHFIIEMGNILHNCNHSVFMYLDPPYPMESRTYKKNIYKYELSTAHHNALLNAIRSANFNIAISTYENTMYATKLKNWRLVLYQSIVRGGTRTEFLYMNYSEPSELHDYKYIGNTFRQRETFNRYRKNYINKFNRFPATLQNSILNQLTSIKK